LSISNSFLDTFGAGMPFLDVGKNKEQDMILDANIQEGKKI
jgi:hypothetical protein